MKEKFVQSVCVFGSVARSNSDCMSDKDILIICSDPHQRKLLEKEWVAKGWSASVYSPSRFIALVEAGSLFVQHLKLEGIIVSDHDNWLKDVLKFARPKPSYSHDARNSIDLALPIERFNNDLLVSENSIVADLAFVCIRNFGINYLADAGNFIFDFEKIADEVRRNFTVSNSEIELLYSLRAGKSAYRSGLTRASLPGTIGDLKSLLGKIFPERPLGTIKSIAQLRNLNSGYARLRDLEAAVVSGLGGAPSIVELNRLGIEDVWRLVTRPHDYSWQVRNFGSSSCLSRTMSTAWPKAVPTSLQVRNDPGQNLLRHFQLIALQP